jgi:thiamine-phosphate pyrophosphorylase
LKNQGRAPLVDFNLYLITDRNGCAGRAVVTVVEEALKGGAKAVQLREKDLPSRELFELAEEMRCLTLRYGAKLFINDRIDIAMAVGADGVHLGERGIPIPQARKLMGMEKMIGVSCHGLESAVAARDMGADFITCGPVFFTPSKAAYGKPLGTTVLSEVTELVRLPVFAIGGINRSTARDVISAGARGIALISAILAANDPLRETETLLALLKAADQQED